MQSIKKFFAILFVVFIVPSAFAETFTVEKPGPDVPPECAIFSEEKGWGQGKWDGRIPNEVWVQKIEKGNGECIAEVVYVWGAANLGPRTPGHKKVSGVIRGSKMFITLRETTKVTYTIENDGKELSGLYERKEPDEAAFVSKIILKRGVQ